MNNRPALVFWELTKRCNLKCIHCRAEAGELAGEELNLTEVKSVIDNIASQYKPIMVLTGGEPLYRKDIFDIADHCSLRGLPVALASNGVLIDQTMADKIKNSKIKRVSISIDGSSAESHDKFRGIKGSYDSAFEGIERLKERDISFQLNITITRGNQKDIKRLIELAEEKGAAAVHFFVLVPVGCGLHIVDDEMLTPDEVEIALKEIYHISEKISMDIKATCAPHYYRIIRQQGYKPAVEKRHGMSAHTRGCLAGTGVCFISSTGDVQPCGYLPLKAGNVLEDSFSTIWEESELFTTLRDYSTLKGKCRGCEFVNLCGGCRARAYYAYEDYLQQEPYCNYEPGGLK